MSGLPPNQRANVCSPDAKQGKRATNNLIDKVERPNQLCRISLMGKCNKSERALGRLPKYGREKKPDESDPNTDGLPKVWWTDEELYDDMERELFKGREQDFGRTNPTYGITFKDLTRTAVRRYKLDAYTRGGTNYTSIQTSIMAKYLLCMVNGVDSNGTDGIRFLKDLGDDLVETILRPTAKYMAERFHSGVLTEDNIIDHDLSLNVAGDAIDGFDVAIPVGGRSERSSRNSVRRARTKMYATLNHAVLPSDFDDLYDV